MKVTKDSIALSDILKAYDGVDPQMYQYFLGLKEGRLLITSEIDESAIEMYVVALMNMESDPNIEKIQIIISSPGGGIFDGMSVCDMIDRLTKPVEMTIVSSACSMGMLIAMAGFGKPNVKKRCFKHALGLIHGGSMHLGGNRSTVRDTKEFLDRYEKKMYQYMADHSKISLETLKEKEDNEWYLTAEEMLQYGIVDEIL